MKLGENLKVIYGTQALRGKILSRKNLGPNDRRAERSERSPQGKADSSPGTYWGQGHCYYSAWMQW